MSKQANDQDHKFHYSHEDMVKQSKMLANRVLKNYRHLRSRFRKQNIDVYRLYYWDIPEIRAVVDWYQGHLVIAEYVRRQTEHLPWLETMAAAVGEALQIPSEKIHLKQRRTRPKDGERYQRLQQLDERMTVNERDLRFLVNLNDFIDTGLFADHRQTRQMVRQESAGKDFLNLFAYTGSFTCYAAAGGAKSTTSIDTSQQYLQWAEDNLRLNDLFETGHHQMLAQDVIQFLQESIRQKKFWDLIVIDPPSFSKRPDSEVFDVQEDHPYLLGLALNVLAPNGRIYFSTNHQRFEPDFVDLSCRQISEITKQTIPEDYRQRQPHRCFILEN
ncbi:MAG: class I SAM-dependent methyltransferase [Oligoflexus sp.]